VVLRALEREPAARHAGAAEFLEAVESAVGVAALEASWEPVEEAAMATRAAELAHPTPTPRRRPGWPPPPPGRAGGAGPRRW